MLLVAAASVWLEGLPSPLLNPFALGGGLIALGLGAGLTRAPEAALAWTMLGLAGTATDGALRTLAADRLYYRPEERFIQRDPRDPVLSRFPPSVRWEGETFGDLAAMLPDASLRVPRKVVFSTDPAGYRGPVPDGPPSVVILGDSFGLGSGVSDEDCWSFRLPREHGLEVASISMPGNPWHELLRFRLEKPRLASTPGVTLVWAIFPGNDLEQEWDDPARPRPRPDPLAIAWWVLTSYRERSPARQLLRRRTVHPQGAPVEVARLPDGRPFLLFREYAEAARRDPAAWEAHPNFPKLARVLESMASEAVGMRVVVAILPTKEATYRGLLGGGAPPEAEASSLGAALAPQIEALGFELLDLAPAFAAEARAAWERDRSLLWWPDDSHWSPAGHALAARLVAERVRAGRYAP